MTDVEMIQHSELVTLFPTYYAAKEPIFLHGNIGIGKSDMIETCSQSIAENSEREFIVWHEQSREEKKSLVENPSDVFIYVDIRMAEIEPTDLRGLPDFTEEYVEWKPPLWVAAVCSPDAAGVIILDEANLAPPLVQSAFYQLVLDRKISARSLADNVYVTGAGNVTEDEAHIHDFPGPLRDRFAHFRLEKPEGGENGTWVEWAADNEIDPRIIGFIGSDVGRGKLYTFGSENADAMAFATPRSWEDVNTLFQAAPDDADTEQLRKLAASQVSPGIATELIEFIKNQESFNIDEYIDDPSTASELDSKQFDEAHAVLSAIAAAHGREEFKMSTLLQITDYISEEYGSYLLTMSRVYADNKDEFRTELQTTLKENDYNKVKDIVRLVS